MTFSYVHIKEYWKYEIGMYFQLSVIEWDKLTGKDRQLLISAVNDRRKEVTSGVEKFMNDLNSNDGVHVLNPTIVQCDYGHQFARLDDHPMNGDKARCPHCLVISLDLERKLRRENTNDTNNYLHFCNLIKHRTELEERVTICDHKSEHTSALGAMSGTEWVCKDCGVMLSETLKQPEELQTFQRFVQASTSGADKATGSLVPLGNSVSGNVRSRIQYVRVKDVINFLKSLIKEV